MERTQPLIAGVVTALVGFASSFTVVLAGLRAVGATQDQAASGLLALCVSVGVVAIILSVRLRMPITIAWSTPGAALLLTTGGDDFAVAVGAFLLCAVAIMAAGLVPALGRLIAAIPAPIASAMLAGVLLKLCLAPVNAVVEVPLMAVPVIIVWLLLYRFARPWAVPGALVAAVAAIVLSAPDGWAARVRPLPVIEFVAPSWSPAAAVGLALPLFLVTMAAQNVPGMAVLSGYGFRPPLGKALLATGLGSAGGAFFGAHAINLAAITAALAASPEGAKDPGRRWIASTTAGASMILLGLAAGLVTTFVALSPPVLVEAVAGLALLGAMSGALQSAFTAVRGRESAAVTFVVTFSGVSFFGVGSAFWGLVAGGVVWLLIDYVDRSVYSLDHGTKERNA
ncbi:benzoate/H(+) symporter BenE family transporter [Nonomuraea sp. NPDC050556]|uniref:benzoate/H(+) symporter BenE family transporter n=1 Tax=Nonomuraea sp. NPDC050556 TaxID=3364369 RepID=UPI0037A9EF34